MAGIHEGTGTAVTVAVAGLTQMVSAAGDFSANVVGEVGRRVAVLMRAPDRGASMAREKSLGDG